jgi:hypothetical protein
MGAQLTFRFRTLKKGVFGNWSQYFTYTVH